jgi:hypothetical protein
MIFANGVRVDTWGGGAGAGVSDRDVAAMRERGWTADEIERLRRTRATSIHDF